MIAINRRRDSRAKRDHLTARISRTKRESEIGWKKITIAYVFNGGTKSGYSRVNFPWTTRRNDRTAFASAARNNTDRTRSRTRERLPLEDYVANSTERSRRAVVLSPAAARKNTDEIFITGETEKKARVRTRP